MAPKRGHLFRCSFARDGFTSQGGEVLVVVLVSEFGAKGSKESLVARADMKDGLPAADLDHVYTVLHDKLKAAEHFLADSEVVDAKKVLAEQIKRQC